MVKISLVFPRTKYVTGDPPLGLAYIAAWILKEFPHADVHIHDATFHGSLARIEKELAKLNPSLVGIFSDTLMFSNAVRIAQFARGLGATVVVGGPHATVSAQSFRGTADYVVRGEGEQAFAAIIRQRMAGQRDEDTADTQIVEQPDERSLSLDAIPFPALELLDMDRYVSAWSYLDSVDTELRGTTMITSRGCPFRCAYCQPTLNMLFGSALRRRSPENVIAEIVLLRERFGVGGIFFHDDTFTLDKAWVLKFCGLLKKDNNGLKWGCNSRIDTVDGPLLEEMHAAGLRNIHFGIEAASQRVLDEVYHKGTRVCGTKNILAAAKKIGISTLGFFMLGAPTETLDEIQSTVDLACRLPLDEASFSIVTPLPGTFLREKVNALPGYGLSSDFKDYDVYRTSPVIKGGVSRRRLKFIQKKSLFFFYGSPKRIAYLLRHLLSLNGMRKLLYKLRRYV